MNDKLIAHAAEKTISARNYIAHKAAENNLWRARTLEGFDELYSKKKELEILLARTEKGSEQYEKTSAELKVAATELDMLLATIGLSQKNLEPNFYCKICGDTGTVDGRICKCKLDLVAKLRERAIGESGNSSPSLSKVKATVFSDEKKEAYLSLKEKLQDFCDKFPATIVRYMIFIGMSGTGKTYLAGAFAKDLEERGFTVLNLSAFALNNTFLKVHTSFDQSLSETFSAIVEADVLIIDDFGTEPIYRNVTKEYFTNVLNERNTHGKVTVVTTNLSPDMIAERYDQRLASRLFDKISARTIYFDFDDLRKKS